MPYEPHDFPLRNLGVYMARAPRSDHFILAPRRGKPAEQKALDQGNGRSEQAAEKPKFTVILSRGKDPGSSRIRATTGVLRRLRLLRMAAWEALPQAVNPCTSKSR